MLASDSLGASDLVLPVLRNDLCFEDSPADDFGRSSLTIIDPLRAAYFRLDWPEAAILSNWRPGTTAGAFAAYLNELLLTHLTAQDISETIEFLHKSQLTATDAHGSWRQFQANAAAGQHSFMKSLVHNYLFFRVPLFHPQDFLRRWMASVECVYTRSFLTVFMVVVAAGGYLVSRQWDVFAATFQQAEKLPGLAIYGCVLIALKAVHELGHAFTTVRYGCRVPTMGVAFMMGAPVLYTDTTDSWRLTIKRQRLAIVGAGVAAEFIAAGAALVCWPFLQDGLLREICFAIVTTSLVTSIFINMNPFMRYDGYYALSDYLGVPNLQSRAFSLARWKLREWLFALGHKPPEYFPPRMQCVLIGYALWTWVYRVTLFAAIAALVYAMVLKVLGIFLGLFEIVVFIALPLAKEVMEWWHMRDEIRMRRRSVMSAATLAFLLAMLFVPWLRHVETGAVLVAEDESPIYLSAAAKVVSVYVVDGQVVEQGQVLLAARSPDLDNKLAKSKIELQALMLQSAGLQSMDKDRELRIVVGQQLTRARAQIASLERLNEQLQIRAPFSGRVVDLDPSVGAGVWQSPSKQIARLVSLNGARARGIVSDTDLSRLSKGAKVQFIPEDVSEPVTMLQLEYVGPASSTALAEPVLAQTYGGAISTDERNGQLVPTHSGFEVVMRASVKGPSNLVRGTVQIEAEPMTPIAAAWRQVARVFVREQGF
jgi:putative peptide zinc metalloprotease protein